MRFNSTLLTITCIILCLILLLSACLPSKIQEEIEITEKENQKLQAEINQKKKFGEKEITPENVELAEEQNEIIDDLEEKSAEEALSENELELRKELENLVPDKRTSFKDPEEFSQYISYLFFAFYKGEMKPEDFLGKILPHAHKEFLNLLPIDHEDQVETFETLQELYIGQLPSPIESYVITDIRFQERAGEATFYRKFLLENGEELYYITVLKREDGIWNLLDDSPSPPYIASPIIENEKKSEKGK